MAKVYKFPGPDTREMIKRIVKLYAQNRISRQVMMNFLALILRKHGVKRLVIDNYAIYLEKVFSTPKLPIVLFEPLTSGLVCPVCGKSESRYLAGEAPKITAWCLGCGCIYERVVERETSREGA